MMDKENKHILDCYGLMCPVPIIKISQKIKELEQGDILEVIATDPGIKQDLVAWCKTTGHSLQRIEEEGTDPVVYRAYIVR